MNKKQNNEEESVDRPGSRSKEGKRRRKAVYVHLEVEAFSLEGGLASAMGGCPPRAGWGRFVLVRYEAREKEKKRKKGRGESLKGCGLWEKRKEECVGLLGGQTRVEPCLQDCMKEEVTLVLLVSPGCARWPEQTRRRQPWF